MSTAYPKDIKSGAQWRVRHESPRDPSVEIERANLTEAQAMSLAVRLLDLNPVVEARQITVGAWGDPSLIEEVDDEADL